MPTIADHVHIDATPDQVWDLLADFGAAERYVPGVLRSWTVTESPSGVGAQRRCDIKGGMLLEEVTAWQEGRGYTVELRESSGVPLQSMCVQFRLEASPPGTALHQTMVYRSKGGVAAPLLDRVSRRMLSRAQRESLAGVKQLSEEAARRG